MVAQRIQVARLRVLDPAGNAAHADAPPFALLAPEEREAGRSVAQAHDFLRLGRRRVIQNRLFIGLSAGNDADLQVAHVRQHIQRHIAELSPVVRLRPDVCPRIQNTEQADLAV